MADATGATAAKALPATDGVLGGTTRQLGDVAGSTSNATGVLRANDGLTDTRAIPAPNAAPAAPALPSSPLSSVPLAGSLPLGSVSGLTGAAAQAPTQRLGGLPGLGDTSGLGNGLSGVGGLTKTLPVGL